MLKKFFLFFLLVFALVANAYASSVEITSKSEVEITVKKPDETIEKKRVPANQVNVGPGDVVFFSNTCLNRGDKPAENVIITNPIPNHTVYVAGSAYGENSKIEFSIDGGKTYGIPEALKVKDKDGKTRLARPEEYTHIRWLLLKPLEPGSQIVVTFQAKIK